MFKSPMMRREKTPCDSPHGPADACDGLTCWLFSDLRCHQDAQDAVFEKLKACFFCSVFKASMDPLALKTICELMQKQVALLTPVRENKASPYEKNRIDREIAERKQAESELRDSETRFRHLVENAPVGIVIMRPDRTYAYMNPTFTDLFGYTIFDVHDRQEWFEKAFPDEPYRAHVIELWKKDGVNTARIGSSHSHTLNICCKDGQKKIVSTRMAVLPNGEHLITYSDITEKARARELIKQSEEKYRALIDNMQDGVFIYQDGVLKFANDALGRMIGYSPGEMLGQSIRLFIAPEDLDTVEHNARRRIRHEDVERDYEFRMLHKNGITRVIGKINVDRFLYRNKPATIGTIKDITAQKQAEKEKRELSVQLQRSQKMEAIGTLAGGVAHDLNNILSGIVSYPDLILMDLPTDSPLRKPIATMKKSGEKAAAIVQDLLTLARRAVSTFEVVNLNEIVGDYLNSPECAHMQACHPNVTVETRLSPDLFDINGSPVHLAKTIMNLVTNAVEAMPAGGVVRLATANRYVDTPVNGYDAVTEGDYVILTVADSGVGISRENLDRIFEPFFTKKVMGRSGTGLGMAVVWGTVKDHQGYIDVLSAEKQGTTFTLYFPVTTKQRRLDIARLSVEDYKGQGETILVVDDSVEQREIAAAMLTKLGYRVHASPSGEAALEYLQTQRVDLVMLDMIMQPGIDGLETYRRLIERHPGQKAIVASGFSLSKRVQAIQDLGAGAYIKKPYTLEKIAVAVRRELDT